MKKWLLALFLLVSNISNTVSYSFSNYANNISEDAITLSKALNTVQIATDYVSNLGIVSYDLPNALPLDLSGFSRISEYFEERECHPILKIRTFHKGIDFSGKKGTPVYAAASGIIKEIKYSFGYGLHVIVDHGNDVESYYAHLQSTKIFVGERVDIGQTIGTLGSTGMSTGPHLHFEVRVKGNAIDPLCLLFESTIRNEELILQTMLNQKNFKLWKQKQSSTVQL